MKKHSVSKRSEFDRYCIRRRDIRNLLRAYCAAIALDQSKVDALPRKHFHSEYSRGMWFRWRLDQIGFIEELIATTGAIPKRLLRDLTVLAARRDPTVVRRTMVEMIGESASLSSGQLDTATLFFQALLKSVGNQRFEPDIRCGYKHCRVRLTRWLKLTDPLRIAEDPECGYLGVLEKLMRQS